MMIFCKRRRTPGSVFHVLPLPLEIVHLGEVGPRTGCEQADNPDDQEVPLRPLGGSVHRRIGQRMTDGKISR